MHKLIKADKWLEELESQSTVSMDDILNYELTLWDKFTSFIWYRPVYKIKHRYYKIKYGIQRCFKGYSDFDVIETYSEFVDRYIKIFTDLKKNHSGYPGNIDEDTWDNILQHMIDCLVIIRDTDNGFENNSLRIKAKDEFMDLFKYWFFDLWD